VVRYLQAGLRPFHSEDDFVQIVSLDASEASGEQGNNFVQIRHEGVLVGKLRLQPTTGGEALVVKEFIALEHPAEGSTSTASHESKPAAAVDESITTSTATSPSKVSKATKRKPAKGTYQDEDDEDTDSNTSDDEVIAVMTQRTRAKRRTLDSQRNKFRRRIPLEEEEEEDSENAEPKDSAGAAQKKRFAEQWQIMLGKLQVYQKEHGDCLVPKDYPLDQALGK
jgi:hypothetical protein